ncbi:hypothetical protein M0R45_023617 [Rubus argutus]|uniref:Uncharacterized protein n=1 Tax=Rubus argutus TaxID=59490 RepID=A0AAW1WRV1_RUBAR
MAESRIDWTTWRSSIANWISDMELCSRDTWFIGCRFRLRSAFDSYSVACEAFSERRFRLIPVGVKIKML